MRRLNGQPIVRHESEWRADRRRRRCRPGSREHQDDTGMEAERKRFWRLDEKLEQRLIDGKTSRKFWIESGR